MYGSPKMSPAVFEVLYITGNPKSSPYGISVNRSFKFLTQALYFLYRVKFPASFMSMKIPNLGRIPSCNGTRRFPWRTPYTPATATASSVAASARPAPSTTATAPSTATTTARPTRPARSAATATTGRQPEGIHRNCDQVARQLWVCR